MGCRIVEEDELRQLFINTCAVTAEAEAKTRKAVRKAARHAGSLCSSATGCVASLLLMNSAPLACLLTLW